MGNSSTTSAPSGTTVSTSPLATSAGAHASLLSFTGANFSFLSLLFGRSDLSDIIDHCHMEGGSLGWLLVKVFILLTAFPANVALMLMLLKTRRSMMPSEVFGLHVSIMDLLYCLSLPLDLYSTLNQVPDSVRSTTESLFVLNVFGCPLLLALMCLEHYVAAARPVAYIRLGRKGYRVFLCVCAWMATVGVGVLGFLVGLFFILLALSAIISLLFLLMLLSLLGIVAVLRQRGPGEGSGSSVPLKRRALKNVAAVTVPAVIAYSPLVALVPYMAVIRSKHQTAIGPTHCDVLQVLLLFPNYGLFIGPLFYMSMSRLRQTSCCNKDQQRE